MQTLIGILVQPLEAQRIAMLIETMQARKHWLTADDCLHEILMRGAMSSAVVYQEGEKNEG